MLLLPTFVQFCTKLMSDYLPMKAEFPAVMIWQPKIPPPISEH